MSSTIHEIEPIQTADEALDPLIKHRGGICLSIYLPIEVEPPASEQNPIRLRKLLTEARAALSSNGMEPKTIDELLAPLNRLEQNPEELLSEAKTLGLFLNGQSVRSIALPFAVDPTIYSGDRYLIKPLVKLRQENPTFTALCLNRGEVRVFQGSRIQIEEVSVPDMPEKEEDVTWIDDPEKSLQQHSSNTVSAEGKPGGAPAGHVHGQGLPSDLERSQLERFLREVGKALDAYLSQDRNPLIIFGVEQNVGVLKSIHKFENRTVLDKHHDPHEWNPETIRKEAWDLLKPECDRATEEKWNLLKAARNKGETIDQVPEAALAACMGQLNLSAIPIDKEVHGICDLDAGEVKLLEAGDPACAHDLIDLIASETIMHGGEVVVLDQEQLPDSAEVVVHKRF
jgi:hypothetical protein